jgi:hypothetical protein
MSKKLSPRAENLRRAVSVEAARLMAEHGISDFLLAKRKAAERFGVEDASVLPKNIEIEAALAEHQRLFRRDTHAASLEAQRQAALRAMRWLEEFEPRLVGSVLSGTATEHVEVQLHLFADGVEMVALRLLDRRIAYEVIERRVKMNAEWVLVCPAVRFDVDDQPVEATVFPMDGIRQSPVSPLDGKPMRRANAADLEALLQES